MKYIFILMLSVVAMSCESSSVLTYKNYTTTPDGRNVIEFNRNGYFEYCQRPFGLCYSGSWSDISSSERVLKFRFQNPLALPATLSSVPIPLASNDSTRVLLRTDDGIASFEAYRGILSFVVETPRGTSVPVSLLGVGVVPRLATGDSLRVMLTMDSERVIPRPTVNHVSSQWLRVTDDVAVLRVLLNADARAFNYRVLNDTLHATRRGWRWGPYEYTPDSQLESSRRDLDL